jgi:hypothetical protein
MSIASASFRWVTTSSSIATSTGSPSEIHLTFNEHVEPRYCRIKLVSDAGKKIERPEAPLRFRHELARRAGLGHIGDDALGTDLGRGGGQSLGTARTDGDTGPFHD